MFELVLDFGVSGYKVGGWLGSHVGLIKCRWGVLGKQKMTLVFSCVIEKSLLEESRGTQLKACTMFLFKFVFPFYTSKLREICYIHELFVFVYLYQLRLCG